MYPIRRHSLLLANKKVHNAFICSFFGVVCCAFRKQHTAYTNTIRCSSSIFFVSLTHQAIWKLKDLNLLFVVCLWWKGMRKFCIYLFIFGINLKCFPAPFVMKINYLFSGSCVILIVDLNKLKDVEYSYFFLSYLLVAIFLCSQ